MTINIKQKNSSVPGKAPLPADIERGELAVNLADKKLFTKDQTDAIVELGGGASDVPGLSDVTVKAAAPYDEPADDSGYLTRIGGKTAGDADEYQIARINLAVGDTAPANPHVGMNWTDTSGAPQDYYWNGVRWVMVGDPTPAPGTFFADFTVEVSNAADAVTVDVKPTGHDDSKSFIQWGDGQKTVGVNGAKTHTYTEVGTYVVRITLAGTAAVLDGGGAWPAITSTSAKLRKVGPLSTGAKVQEYGWGTADTAEIDMANIVPAQLTSAEGLFRDRLALTPDKVKGIDPAKLSSVASLIENRADIKLLPWTNLPEATSLSKLAKSSGIRTVTELLAPKATDCTEAFAGTALTVFDGKNVDLSGATNCTSMFHSAFVDSFDGFQAPSLANAEAMFSTASFKEFKTAIVTGPSLVRVNGVYYTFTVDKSPEIAYLSDTSSVNINGTAYGSSGNMAAFIASCDGTTCAKNQRVYSFATMNNCKVYDFTFVGGVPQTVWPSESLSLPNATKVGISWPGGRMMLESRGPVATSNCTDVPSNMFDTTTGFTLGNNGLSIWKNASLTQAAVDEVLRSLDVAVAAGATGNSTAHLAGSSAAPSAATVSGPVARLTAAGWNITTN